MHVLGNLGIGGAETGVIRLVKAFSERECRQSIVILGSDLTLRDMVAADIPCHSLGITGPCYTAFWSLSKLFREQDVDIVHVNNPAPWLDAAFAAKLAGCKCIQTFHGVEQGTLSYPWPKRILYQFASLLSSQVTAVAEPAANLLSSLTGIPKGDIEVIPNGIDTATYSQIADPEKRRGQRKKMGLPENLLLFGCVAALRPVKNHKGLLTAFANAVKSCNRGAALVFIGGGPLQDDLLRQSQELGISGNVLMLGERSDVPDLLNCLDVFILNSETEGLSYAVLEAMASGLPIVATRVGANPQLVSDGVEGLLVQEGDSKALTSAINDLLEDPTGLPEMGRLARKRVLEKFSFEAMVQKYRALYERVLF